MIEGCEIHKCTLWQSTEILSGSVHNTVMEQLLGFVKQTTAKLCAAGYVVRTMGQDHVSNSNTIKSIYYAYCHYIIICRIICAFNSSKSGKIFVLHKKGILLMAAAPTRTSSSNLFTHPEILPVLFQFI
jgi:hypothetical protein